MPQDPQDPQNCHLFALSDEAFERENGERKLRARTTSARFRERDLMVFELATYAPAPVSATTPQESSCTLLQYNVISLCGEVHDSGSRMDEKLRFVSAPSQDSR